MFPRVTHPSATDVSLRPFDLHVLGLPPAFVLSQDQTLKLNENLSLAGHFTYRNQHRYRRFTTDALPIFLSTSPKHTCL
jgi:hypothetical protein